MCMRPQRTGRHAAEDSGVGDRGEHGLVQGDVARARGSGSARERQTPADEPDLPAQPAQHARRRQVQGARWAAGLGRWDRAGRPASGSQCGPSTGQARAMHGPSTGQARGVRQRGALQGLGPGGLGPGGGGDGVEPGRMRAERSGWRGSRCCGARRAARGGRRARRATPAGPRLQPHTPTLQPHA